MMPILWMQSPTDLNRRVGSKDCYAVIYIARISRLANKRPNLVTQSNTRQVCVWTVNMWFRLEHKDNIAEVKAENMLHPKAHNYVIIHPRPLLALLPSTLQWAV